MAKSIKCSDVGIDCDWSASADNEEELMKKIAEHAKEHGYTEVPPELLVKVKENIKEV